METGWVRVGAAVRAARAEQNLTQEELGERVGVSTNTVRAIERGQEFTKVTPTLRAIEAVLGWGNGTIDALLRGDDPPPAPRPAPAAETPSEAISSAISSGGLPWRVLQALKQGLTLDGAVVPLGPNANMVVLVQGNPAATPEELEAELLEWERQEGHLRRLGEVADEPGDTEDK